MDKRKLKGIDAKVIEHTITEHGDELITFQLQIVKYCDAEVEKHRQISSNSSSDRAIPFNKMCEADYYIPEEFRINQAGMQGYEKLEYVQATSVKKDLAILRNAAVNALKHINNYSSIHKQHLNRYLLPWSYQSKVATMNKKWLDAFLHLRLAEGADPAIQELAKAMQHVYSESIPKLLSKDEWHLPYINESERDNPVERLIKASVARCARVSYNNHDGSSPDIEKDIKLHDMLLRAGHMSCFEHVAKPMMFTSHTNRKYWQDGVTHMDREGRLYSGNFHGYIQYRQALPYSCNNCGAKHTCKFAWDEYNVNGDCLAVK